MTIIPQSIHGEMTSMIVMRAEASYNAFNVTLIVGTIKMALPKKKTIALIAHDGKKAEMISFVKDNIEFFKKFELVATSTTGKLVAQTGLKVKRYLSGPVGGDAQITALVATEKCHAVIFMRDPLGMHPHEPDIYSLLRICDVHDVPLATNLSSAQLIVKGLAKNLLKE